MQKRSTTTSRAPSSGTPPAPASPYSKKSKAAKLSPSGNLAILVVTVAIAALLLVVGMTGFAYHSLSSSSSGASVEEHEEPARVEAKEEPSQQQLRVQETPPTNDAQQHNEVIDNFRQEFKTRYGAADSMTWFDKAVEPFGNVDITAARMLAKFQKKQSFVMSFAGYSVTVGRGNHLSESFPLVLERLLKPILKDVLDIDLEVRNAAIGGIPSFPYAFCFEHFLGHDADVMSWDYSMNEGSGESALEAYIRLSRKNMPLQPMLIVLDKNPGRGKLLKQYASAGLLSDGLVLHRAADVLPKKITEVEEGADEAGLPVGLQNWNVFGAPAGCPGRSPWHPKKAEHELLGYMLAMHFCKAIERALVLKKDSAPVYEPVSQVVFPAPLVTPAGNPKAVTELLYGHESPDHNDVFQLQQLSCRTSFLPAQDVDKILPSVVVNGLIQPDLDMMQDRSDDLYHEGWVLDVSKIERETKKKVERCGGLEYIDMKVALYGIPESGALRLWLPYEGALDTSKQESAAQHWFDDLMLCEANEKRDEAACQLDHDLEITVGGVDASELSMVDGVGVYLNRKTCLAVAIPESAKVTLLKDVTTSSGEALSESEQERLAGGRDVVTAIGLVVDLKAGPKVTRSSGACCVSHIVWEQN